MSAAEPLNDEPSAPNASRQAAIAASKLAKERLIDAFFCAVGK